MMQQGRPSRRMRAILLISLGVLLLWHIATGSFAAYLAQEAPQATLALNPAEPTALATLADNRLNPRKAWQGAADTAARQGSEREAQPLRPRGDRIAAWSEIALKAAADRLPLDRSKGAHPGRAAGDPLPPEDRALIARQAEAALRSDPLNARALRILGQLAHADGDERKATRLMRAAADRSLGESIAVHWMLQQSFLAKDYEGAAAYADTFLRKRPRLMAEAAPVLARMAEGADAKAVEALKKVLAERPPWRPAFFAALPGHITDARTPLNLLLSVREQGAPPTERELGAYLSFLIANRLYELAYYTWLQFLPAELLGRAGLLANGSFEQRPSGLPFDWVVSQGSGVTVDIVARADVADQRALFLEFGPGRAEFRGVSQLVMLMPGAYRLKGRIKGELAGPRGLQWSVTCADGRARIGEGPMFTGLAPIWTDFDVTFRVPRQECRAQYVRLALAARSASEQLVSGSVWYDELAISRLEAGPEPSPDAGPGGDRR